MTVIRSALISAGLMGAALALIYLIFIAGMFIADVIQGRIW